MFRFEFYSNCWLLAFFDQNHFFEFKSMHAFLLWDENWEFLRPAAAGLKMNWGTDYLVDNWVAEHD